MQRSLSISEIHISTTTLFGVIAHGTMNNILHIELNSWNINFSHCECFEEAYSDASCCLLGISRTALFLLTPTLHTRIHVSCWSTQLRRAYKTNMHVLHTASAYYSTVRDATKRKWTVWHITRHHEYPLLLYTTCRAAPIVFRSFDASRWASNKKQKI